MHYPHHIAIIPDGNRTWATDQGLSPIDGHLAGQENSIRLMKYIFSQTPIQVATFWGLSFENTRNRSREELSYLFTIYKTVLAELVEFMKQHKINFTWIGSRVGLPDDLLVDLDTIARELNFPTDTTIVFAINYGGRDEILRGIKTWTEQDRDVETLTEASFSACLDLGDVPPVDLVIRTKGDVAKRLSGFMLWWIGYAELYFTDIKFPAFDTHELHKALQWFDEMYEQRNFGK